MIPVLLLMDNGLYKTERFGKPVYVGDPINTVRIFNDKGADELVLLDITRDKTQININLIRDVAGEAFMPMSYGGCIRSFDDAQLILNAGFEKAIVNTCAMDSRLISKVSNKYGRQSMVVSIDVGKNWRGQKKVFIKNGRENTGYSPVEFAKRVADAGAGEIILNAIYKDGTWSGYDLELVREVSNAVEIPVVALGGASGIEDFYNAVRNGASAVAAGSYFLFQKKGMGVLIRFPDNPLSVS